MFLGIMEGNGVYKRIRFIYICIVKIHVLHKKVNTSDLITHDWLTCTSKHKTKRNNEESMQQFL